MKLCVKWVYNDHKLLRIISRMGKVRSHGVIGTSNQIRRMQTSDCMWRKLWQFRFYSYFVIIFILLHCFLDLLLASHKRCGCFSAHVLDLHSYY